MKSSYLSQNLKFLQSITDTRDVIVLRISGPHLSTAFIKCFCQSYETFHNFMKMGISNNTIYTTYIAVQLKILAMFWVDWPQRPICIQIKGNLAMVHLKGTRTPWDLH